jgi:hypothetical protein
MGISVDRYEEHMVPAVAEFNLRLRRRGVDHRFPESAESSWLPPRPGRAIFEEYFVARDGDQVRGGYVLKHQPFGLGGHVIPVGNFRFPLSEGIVEPAYRAVGVRFLRHALRRRPLLYSVGLGGYDQPVTRMLAAAGFRLTKVPFYFKVLRPVPFLRNIRALRSSRLRGVALDLLAASGLGAAAIWAADRVWWRERVTATQLVSWEQVGAFGPWADALWRRALARYPVIGARDAATLAVLYPPEDRRFIRLRVREGSDDVGWAVLLDTRMSGSPYFGDMRVVSVVDCLTAPEAADRVAWAALRFARRAGADLALTNQGHRAFRDAFLRAGWIPGPSNYLLALSPALAAEATRLGDDSGEQIHMSRGDGDGPVHL